MTREEAITLINSAKLMLINPTDNEPISDLYTALDMAIKALSQEPTIGQLFSCEEVEELRSKIWKQVEQEPCDDAISRDMALEKMADYVASGYADSAEDFEEYSRIICELPSVTQKSGYWIEDAKTYYEELNKRGLGVDEYTPYFTDDIACSECLAKYSTIDNETEFFKYCPNCGAKMESEEQTEKG